MKVGFWHFNFKRFFLSLPRRLGENFLVSYLLLLLFSLIFGLFLFLHYDVLAVKKSFSSSQKREIEVFNKKDCKEILGIFSEKKKGFKPTSAVNCTNIFR